MHHQVHERPGSSAPGVVNSQVALDANPSLSPRYTSRIQKGGALFDEMRQLVAIWTDAPADHNRSEMVRLNPLNKATRARVVDVLNRIFMPRFVNGPIRESWKLLAPLERLNASAALVRPIYLWITALAEPILYDFSCDYLSAKKARGLRAIDVSDAASWIGSKGNNWSETVVIKVTRALLAALRDFGVLEGKAKKRIASLHLPLASFAYLAFCFQHHRGVNARNLLTHPDWRLFMLAPTDVEHLLLEAHQSGMLEYHAAGSVVNLSFPALTAEEYALVVLRR